MATITIPTGGPLSAHRPVVMGRRGLVASAHYLASLAGLCMFFQGGNAVDAAVAAAAALNVVEPYMSGMGGIGWMLISRARTGERRVLNFSGYAPAAAVPEAFTLETRKEGIRAPIVPGNLAGWLTALETYGRLSREEVFSPAIELAEQGYPTSVLNSRFFTVNQKRLCAHPTTRQVFYAQGRPPQPSEILIQPDLARSFRAVVKAGREALYGGPLGREIARFCQEQGGLLTEQDFATYHPEWVEPITVDYQGYQVVTPPPNSNAFQILESLNILEGYELAAMGHNSPDYLHTLIEAMKLAVTDRIAYSADPHRYDIPLAGLLSKPYAEALRSKLHPRQANLVCGERYVEPIPAGSLLPGSPSQYLSGETTHLSAVDADGTAVSITQTLGGAFGCGVVAGTTGLLLNNNMDWFEIDPKSHSRNLVAPGKRLTTSMSPTQVFRDGEFRLTIGTPGSYGILQTTLQMLLNFVAFGMTVQEAIEAPRCRVISGTTVKMENRVPAEAREELARRGHDIQLIGEWSMEVGGGHGIARHPTTGILMGGADPRRDGYALGL
jgi:gamma-glutamyltranspeptidase / glutathione hydrolase